MLMEPTPAGKSGVFDTLAEKVVTALAGMPETPATLTKPCGSESLSRRFEWQAPLSDPNVSPASATIAPT